MSYHNRSTPTSAEEGKSVRLLCGECRVSTTHSIVKSIEFTEQDGQSENLSVITWSEYQIIECRGCETPSFRSLQSNSEDYSYDPETSQPELIVTEQLFPHRIDGRGEIEEVWCLPHPVKTAYKETIAALHGSLRVLAGIGIRAIVEAVCQERSANGRNLAERIDALVAQGVMTSDGAKVLQSLRLLGNDAAHEIREHSLETLSAAMDVVDHLLIGVYVIPTRAERLRKSRGV